MGYALCSFSIDQECVDKKGLILVEIREIMKRLRALVSLSRESLSLAGTALIRWI
jgi:hypothetical protein